MNIINNINVLLAKLTEKQYAPYKELYESMKEEYDKKYDHIFGVGNNRLYLDDTIRIGLMDYLGVKNLGTAYIAIQRILQYCNGFYYFKDTYYDFACNRVYDKNGRTYKLTKLLQLLTDEKLKDINEAQYKNIHEWIQLYKDYNERDLLTDYALNLPPKSIMSDNSGVNLSVVISRDPYDIVGMSTDRRWRSCMRLPNDNDPYDEGGQCNYHLQHDIKLGTLVAYLIEPTDKNIDKPYARIAIKPHYNIENKSVYLFSEDKVYSDNTLMPQTYKNFKSVVDEFLNEVQNDIEGVFELPDQLYPDSETRIKTHGDLIKYINFDFMFEFDDGKKIYKNFPLITDYTITYDIYIFNNKKHKIEYKNNNLVTVVKDKLASFHNRTDDKKIHNVYSIYITKAGTPIEKHIARIDISIGIFTEFMKIKYNKVVADRPKIYIENLSVTKELEQNEKFIDTIFNFVIYIFYK